MWLLEERKKNKEKSAVCMQRMPMLYFLGDFRAGTFFTPSLQTITAWLSLHNTGYIEISLWDSTPGPTATDLCFKPAMPQKILVFGLSTREREKRRPHKVPS